MSSLGARSQHALDVRAIAQAVMQRLERAWNRADGAAFGEPFSAQADFVAIRGDLHTGREATPRAISRSSTRSTLAARSATRFCRRANSTIR
jgi:uncharacterized protein (TIGR02246 family)